MRKNLLFSTIGIVWFLCLSLVARGVTPITVSGPVIICAGNSGNYFISPTTGFHYVWSVTPQGNITGSNTNPTVNVLWGTPGTGTVTVDGYDSTNTLQQVGTLTVTIAPIPSPYITADKIAGCQNYADTPTHGRGENQLVPGDPHILDDGSGCPKVCDSSVVTYTANGPVGSHFGWVVSGGTIIGLTSTTCTVFWNGPVGFGSITLYDTSMYGCVGTKTVCIDIIAKPHAKFSAPLNVCLNQSVTFLDLSTAIPTSPIINWYWDFGDGGTFTSSSSTSVSHTYTLAGTYTVTLVVKNQCGCTDTFRARITVNPQQGVTIVCPGVVCDSTSASYKLSPSVPCSSYLWHITGGDIVSGAGTPNITVFWDKVDSSGFGYVSFDASPCHIPCPSVTTIKVPVVSAHGYIFGPKIVCPYTQYLYNMPQWPTTTFTWTVLTSTGATLWPTDQNNQIALNTHGAGTIVLKCVYQNTMLGCGGIAYDTITVVPPDSILGALQQCFGSTGTYQLGSGSVGTWTLTYPNHTTLTNTTSIFSAPFNQVGTYELNVTGSFCLSQPITIRVDSLPPAPDSLLGPDTVCFGIPVDFKAKNSLPGSVFGWAVVTGTPPTASGDHATFSLSGSSPATVMVWRESMSPGHCHSDTLRKLVYKPVVNLNITGPDTVCPSTVYTYNSNYTEGETYSWTLNSPLKGSVQVDGHSTSQILFNTQTGLVDVIVKVIKCGTPYFDTIHVYIRPLPALSLSVTPNPVCRDVPIIATLLNGNIGTISWNWGDGSPFGSGVSANHSYTSLLTTTFSYTVVCTVTNPYGCAGTVTANVPVTVLPAPVANITPDGPFFSCTRPAQPLTATLTSGFEPTNTLIWQSVSAGTVASCGTPFPCNPYTVTNYGTYYVIAVGANGCRDTSNYVLFDTCHPVRPCTIAGNPYATIDSATIHCGAVHLHGTYAAFPTAFSWRWGWPLQAQGVTTTSNTLNCSFLVAGAYTFTYTVGFTDASRDTCYFVGDTTIIVPFIAGMGHSVTCSGSGYNVTMFDHSNYYPGHAPYKYSWYVDGGHVGTTAGTSFTASLSGGASHTLNVWEYYGPGTTDSCLASDNVFLDSLPHASFKFARDTTCALDASVQFTNLSTPVSSAWSSSWLFGDGSGNTETSPWRVYSAAGLYSVTLTITNGYGCTDDTTIVVPIVPENLAGHVSGDSVACAGSIVVLSYIPQGSTLNPEKYYWMEGTDSMYMTTSGSINIYTSGSYWVIGTNHYGCFTHMPPMTQQSIRFITPPPAVILGDSSQCINVPYTLNGYAGSDPTITYTWLKNGVAVGSGPTYTDPATAIGTFTYQLVIGLPNPTGGFCYDTSAAFNVTVHALPAPPSIVDNIVDCNTYTIKLTAIGPTYGSYNWSNSMFGQTITVPEGGGPYKVWYTDTFGCVSNASIMVPRDPRLYLWVFPSGCYGPWCKSSLPRTIIGPIEPFDYWAYLMDPSTIVESGFNSPVGSYSITGPGDYQLILQNMFCTDTSGIMDVSIVDCQPCKQIQFQPMQVYQTGCDQIPPLKGFKTTATAPDTCCHDYIVINFNNVGPNGVGISLSTTNGTLAPAGTFVPVGSLIDTFQFIPDPGFYGGTIVITMTYTDPVTGQVFTCQQTFQIPPCDPKLKNAGNEPNTTVRSADGLSAIRLVPNPAQNSTRVDYQFNGDASSSYIEVYDMMGRLINKHQVTDTTGSWQLQLGNYAAGIYEVVVRQNGRAILQSRLSVTH